MTKTIVYFMPGLAASSSIFEYICLPKEQFEMVYLDWIEPHQNETLAHYAKRMTTFVKHENPVLIGVSFGGIVVQEMAVFLDVKKIIIVSSIKSSDELPSKMHLAKKLKLYKIMPTSLVKNVNILAKFTINHKLKQRIELYKKYLTMSSTNYLDWAIAQVVCWERTQIDPKVIHIHGEQDSVFPVKNISNYISVKGGTHVMIINRFKWFNDNLPKIILQD